MLYKRSKTCAKMLLMITIFLRATADQFCATAARVKCPTGRAQVRVKFRLCGIKLWSNPGGSPGGGMIAVGIDWHITESTDIEGICQACFESDPLEEADGDKISWVAGDNCDKLYHVVCLVGYVDKFRKCFATHVN